MYMNSRTYYDNKIDTARQIAARMARELRKIDALERKADDCGDGLSVADNHRLSAAIAELDDLCARIR
jgi:hypothetical protein